jgi:hypothetical protein
LCSGLFEQSIEGRLRLPAERNEPMPSDARSSWALLPPAVCGSRIEAMQVGQQGQ